MDHRLPCTGLQSFVNRCRFSHPRHGTQFPVLASAHKSENIEQNLPRHSNTFWQTDVCPMSNFFSKLRQTAIAGFFFLFPLYVVFIVISKAWTSLTSIGAKLASMFGVKSVLGVGGPHFSRASRSSPSGSFVDYWCVFHSSAHSAGPWSERFLALFRGMRLTGP